MTGTTEFADWKTIICSGREGPIAFFLNERGAPAADISPDEHGGRA